MNDNNKREEIEWLNYWIEDVDVNEKKRVILLGDSVTRDLRKKLSFYMNKDYAVDLLAMSYSIFDDRVIEEIKHFFQLSTYQYDFIVYQMGVHHDHCIKCAESAEATEQFQCRTMEILHVLKQYTDNVIAMTSTLESDLCEGKRVVSNDYKREIEARDRVLDTVAEKLNIFFYDLNKRIDYSKVKFSDWSHFYEKGYEYIAEQIMADLFPDICCVSSNQVETLRELEKKLEAYRNKRVYIYGNGIRGERIRKYLQMQQYNFDGFIVSDEYEESFENVIGLIRADKDNALVIVTPEDLAVWERLEKKRFDYISLHPDINTFLRMYIDTV